MQHERFWYRVEAAVRFTGAELAYMRMAAVSHYDGVCRGMAERSTTPAHLGHPSHGKLRGIIHAFLVEHDVGWYDRFNETVDKRLPEEHRHALYEEQMATRCAELGDMAIVVSLTWDQVDTLAKVMELGHMVGPPEVMTDIAWGLKRLLKEMRSDSERVNAEEP